MKFGLDEETLNTIEDAIKPFPEIEQAIVYGSRAMGNFKPYSDIDMALKGNRLTSRTVNALHAFLNDGAPRFPYKVDVLNYHEIVDDGLKKHIDQYGKILFTR
ncbi:MAG TPA: DNA polymerase III subunit beta [Candidatus Taylorbacteria bacterium]|nr:MAG: polymerase beta domain protein region protein [Parcubacteria group bacterium GW2011_GWC2_48_17]HBV00813.1 DNA polymerase III subunit beta [Candidatus Taylorbacteria bacterium]